jgi:hypothetical protein
MDLMASLVSGESVGDDHFDILAGIGLVVN